MSISTAFLFGMAIFPSVGIAQTALANADRSFAEVLRSTLGSVVVIVDDRMDGDSQVLRVRLRHAGMKLDTFAKPIQVFACDQITNRQHSGSTIRVIVEDSSGAASAEVIANSARCGGTERAEAEASDRRCAAYVGETLSPVAFDAVAATVSKLPNRKGEYETNAQFNARVADARNGQPSTYIVHTPFDPKFATYDADAGILNVDKYAIDNITTRWSGVFGYGTPFSEKVKFTDSGWKNIDIVVSESKMVTGSYRASNAFGTTINVRKERRVTKAIFDREAIYEEDLLSAKRSLIATQSSVIAKFSVSPNVARSMKSTMQAALVIEPKAPFYATGKVDWGEPTLQAPFDIDESQIAIIADIQCVLILDGSGIVISGITTR